MTAYVPIADSENDPESPITTSYVTKMRDNPIAITEKAAGAPVLANDYVVKAMISTSTVSLAGSLPDSTRVYVTLSSYCFFPMIHALNAGGVGAALIGHNIDGASADSPRVGMTEDSGGGNGSYDIDYRYIDV